MTEKATGLPAWAVWVIFVAFGLLAASELNWIAIGDAGMAALTSPVLVVYVIVVAALTLTLWMEAPE